MDGRVICRNETIRMGGRAPVNTVSAKVTGNGGGGGCNPAARNGHVKTGLGDGRAAPPPSSVVMNAVSSSEDKKEKQTPTNGGSNPAPNFSSLKRNGRLPSSVANSREHQQKRVSVANGEGQGNGGVKKATKKVRGGGKRPRHQNSLEEPLQHAAPPLCHCNPLYQPPVSRRQADDCGGGPKVTHSSSVPSFYGREDNSEDAAASAMSSSPEDDEEDTSVSASPTPPPPPPHCLHRHPQQHQHHQQHRHHQGGGCHYGDWGSHHHRHGGGGHHHHHHHNHQPRYYHTLACRPSHHDGANSRRSKSRRHCGSFADHDYYSRGVGRDHHHHHGHHHNCPCDRPSALTALPPPHTATAVRRTYNDNGGGDGGGVDQTTCFSLLSPHSCPGDRLSANAVGTPVSGGGGGAPTDLASPATTYQFQGQRHRCGSCGYSYESLVAFGGPAPSPHMSHHPPPHTPLAAAAAAAASPLIHHTCHGMPQQQQQQQQHSRLGRRHHLRSHGASQQYPAVLANAAAATMANSPHRVLDGGGFVTEASGEFGFHHI